MKVLVTGANGMLGSDLCEALAGKHEVIGVDMQDFDITDRAAVAAAVRDLAPQWMVHCAAWTDVDGCERDPARAFRQNALGTGHVAAAAAAAGAALVYLSTDYVFDGEKAEPYTEFDHPNPVSVYGASKLAGEEAVRRLSLDYYLVRSAWLYGRHGNNFVRTILQAAETREVLQVVGDQYGSPTYTRDLAQGIVDLILSRRLLPGVHHLVNSGTCSWAELAAEALRLAGRATRVEPIPASEWPSPTRRPAQSVLRSRWLELMGLPTRRDWKAALADYLKEMV